LVVWSSLVTIMSTLPLSRHVPMSNLSCVVLVIILMHGLGSLRYFSWDGGLFHLWCPLYVPWKVHSRSCWSFLHCTAWSTHPWSTIPNILELYRWRTSLKSVLLTNWLVHTDFGVTCYVIRSFVTSDVLDFVGVWSEIQFGVKTSVGILIIWKNDKCYMILRHTSKDVLTIRLEEKTCKSNQNFINLDSAMSFIFHYWIYINTIAKEFIQFSIFHPR